MIDLRSDTVTRPTEAMRRAMAAAEVGDDVFGEDPTVERLQREVAALVGKEAALFVPSGTMANQIALLVHARPGDEVVVSEGAHCAWYESGAGAAWAGVQFAVAGSGPVFDVDALEAAVKPRVYYYPRTSLVALENTHNRGGGRVLPQGTVVAVAARARALGLAVHLDGARFANAVAALGCAPADLAQRAGVDVLAFGGTKNGLPFGEALVFFDAALADEFARRRKQAGHLVSKMRFLAAPWIAMLEGGRWLAHAAHANAMARRLSEGLARVPGATLIAPTQANGVFVDLPARTIEGLEARGWRFYVFVGETGCRFMCAWDTRAEDVDRLVADVAALAA